ncbi:MAG: 50S ribosomal protein L24 [Candidatus Altiarchaeota archaeon]
MKKPTSQQPRKQRKWLANAPLHSRHKLMSATFSKELKEKYKRGSFPVRKGDTVKIMRGSFKGHSGEIMSVDMKKYKIYVNGVTAKKSDGTEVERPMHPSNVMLTAVHEEDKKRRALLSKKTEDK